MRKKDYQYKAIVMAFIAYSNAGCLDTEDYIKSLPEESRGGSPALDIAAVNQALENISERPGGEDIKKAVLKIYRNNMKRMGARIRRYSFEAYADERTIYRWLAVARNEFAKCRGLEKMSLFCPKKSYNHFDRA